MKKISFISSTRADYGLLKEPMLAVQSSADFELQLLLTGTHLSDKFGSTHKEVEHDGFKIDQKIDLGDLTDSNLSMALQVSRAVEGTAKALEELKPDALVVLGDRYEILGATQAAFFLNIPIVHLHGGEVTQGAIDDSIRHSITKLAHYHVTSTNVYRNRVLQLGEDPDKVFCLGSTGLENLLKDDLMTKEALEESLNFKFKQQNLLITFHPVTAAKENISELISALSHFSEVGQIITLPNSDPGYESIRDQVMDYAKNKDHVFVTPSLGQKRYNSAMKIVDVVVGNSSSGIVEAPFCGTRTLNVGERQKGRVMDSTKITSIRCDAKSIKDSLKNLLSADYTKSSSNLYGEGNFSKKFLDLLGQLDFTTKKKFFDLNAKY